MQLKTIPKIAIITNFIRNVRLHTLSQHCLWQSHRHWLVLWAPYSLPSLCQRCSFSQPCFNPVKLLGAWVILLPEQLSIQAHWKHLASTGLLPPTPLPRGDSQCQQTSVLLDDINFCRDTHFIFKLS